MRWHNWPYRTARPSFDNRMGYIYRARVVKREGWSRRSRRKPWVVEVDQYFMDWQPVTFGEFRCRGRWATEAEAERAADAHLDEIEADPEGTIRGSAEKGTTP